MILFIFSLKTIIVVISGSNIFLWVAASIADAVDVNPNGIKTLLANGLSTFFMKDNPVFSDGPKNIPKNLPNCFFLCNWVFYNFILAKELFAKALRILEIFVLVNKNLCGKLFLSSESPTTFDESFRVTLVPFFIPDFNLLRWVLDKCYIEAFYIDTIVNQNEL